MAANTGTVEPTYMEDYKESINAFRDWIREAKGRNLSTQLYIRTTPIVAVTVLAIDPDSSSGQIVVTPTVLGRSYSAQRPHFWVSKGKHPAAFRYYWDAYKEIFNKAAKPLEALPTPLLSRALYRFWLAWKILPGPK